MVLVIGLTSLFLPTDLEISSARLHRDATAVLSACITVGFLGLWEQNFICCIVCPCPRPWYGGRLCNFFGGKRSASEPTTFLALTLAT